MNDPNEKIIQIIRERLKAIDKEEVKLQKALKALTK